ncbi:LamG-like jellyroll fold domain-containing protein, partial [Pseudotenacibaculum haliotis]
MKRITLNLFSGKPMSMHQKNLRILCLFFFFAAIFLNQEITAQSIPGTGTSAGICGNCNPTGWSDADPALDGTPDISNRNQAGGEGTYGAGATWTAAPLPLPPTGDVRWITLRDVGTSGSIEENVTTTMTGLVPGTIYKLTINTMTSTTNSDGGTGSNEPYAGQFIEDFDIQVGSNPRRTFVVPASSRNVWGTNTIIFLAESASETFTIFPGADSNAGNNINDVEMIHISVDGVSALQVLDTDGDGIGDTVDIDDDNDGILDTVESGGLDPNGDEDGDGIANYQDVNDDGTGDGSSTNYTDANADGLPDAFDFDGDGVPNHLDLDSDNDGILDNIEAQTDAGFIAFSSTDTDNDGLVDVYDATPSGGASGSNGITPNVFDPGLANDDTTPDYLDIDTDDDGIPDNVEAQTTTGYTAPTGNVGENGVDSAYENVDTYSPTGITIVNTDLTDLPDYRDGDSDNDGTTDINENGEGNVLSGSDTDGDGLDNNFDADNSNYDVNDNINTPSSVLPDEDGDVNTGGDVDYRDDVTGTDTDGDKIPDIVDLDDDNDGIMDTRELCNTAPGTTVNSTITIDINFDNYSEDITWNLRDPSNAIVLTEGPYAANQDTDLGNTYNATVAGDYTLEVIDSFGDGFTESGGDSDALAFIRVQVDGVTVYDTTSAYGNYGAFGSGFTTPAFTISANLFSCINGDPSADDDDDGTPNYRDADYSTGVGGDTINANGTWSSLDHDGDGVPDHLDLDSDNDGITDNLEAQTTAGYVALAGVDTDNDGLDDAYDPDCSPCGAVTGIEIIPTNTDSDSSPDYKDIDADDDGIPDNVEAQTTNGYNAPNGVPGENGLDSAYDFTDSFSSTGLNSSLVNTDGTGEPDFRDTDSDGDGTPDIQENGDADNTVSGTDTDGDGLDDNFEGSSNNDVDPNDEINTPSTDLPDADSDVNAGGDVDYRDTLNGIDTDGDGIVDSVDIDDDNDGITDVEENRNCAPSVAGYDGYWTFDNTTNDSSGNGHNLTNSPTIAYSTNSVKGTHSFDFSTGTFLRYSIDGTFLEQAITNFSYSFWFYPTTLTGEQFLIEEGGGTNGFAIRLNGDQLECRVKESAVIGDTSSFTIPSANTWYHVVATYANGELILYLDSEATAPVATGIGELAAHSGDSGFGGDNGGDVYNGSGDFSGLMDDIIHFPFALTPAQVSLLRGCDFDGDGIINSLDQDSDGDGILDVVEAQTTAGYVAPTGSVGANGLYDIYENNDTPSATGLTPVTTVNDGNPDYLDIDTDDDGIPDNVEAQTTTGYTAPSGTVGLNGVDSNYENNDTFTATGLSAVNTDGTDELDFRDTDSDNDGTSDADESGITLNPGSLGTDSDGDGLDDIYEGSDATAGEAFDVNDEINDPVNNLLDADGDGATTGDVDYRDDTIFIDTDGDGIEDSVDLDDDNDGILDTVEDAAPDGDGDGIPNRLDIDSDNDGIPDNIEAQSTLGYIAPSGSGSGITDANMDGVDDNYAGGLTPVNTDNITGNNSDATPDYLDADSDGDGINDILENGNANATTGTDTDGDGLDDAFEGVLSDNDVNDDIDDPATDLPDIDSDVNTADGAQPDAPEYNDVDYRDIDDDRAPPSVAGNILWLRADIGVTGVGEVTNWADQSGSSFNATNTGTGPAKLGDGTATDGLNFNPTLQFTEASGHDLEIGSGGILGSSVTYDHLWVYAVTESNSATNASYAVGNNVTGGSIHLQAPTTGSQLSYQSSTGTTLTTAWGGTANVFNIWNGGSSSGTSTPSGTNKAIYRDGLQLATNNTGNGVQFTSNGSSFFIGSDNNGANFFDGQIAEIMVFNTVPTSAEQQKIQSYLAIKYGITLDQTDNDA